MEEVEILRKKLEREKKAREILENMVETRTRELYLINKKIEKEKSTIQKYLNVVEVMIISIDSDEKVTLINRKGCEILGYEERDIIGKKWFDNFLPRDIRDEVKGVFERLISGEIELFEYYENSIVNKNGEKRDIAWHNTVLKDNDGKIICTLSSGEDITERKEIEEELIYRFETEKIVNSISSKFINHKSEEIDDRINHSLRVIGDFTGVDRSYIFKFSTDEKMMDNTHEWCAEGIEPQMEKLKDLPVDIFPWWMEKLKKFENIHIPRVDELPPEANQEKEILQAQNILSLIVVPMSYDDSLIGFLGFDSIRKENIWEEEDIALLRTVGNIFVSAFKQNKAIESIKESEERFRLLFENAGDGILISNPETKRFISANKKMCDLTGYSLSEFSNLNVENIQPEKDLSKVVEEFDKHVRGEILIMPNLPILRKDGTIFYADINLTLVIINGVECLVGIFRDITERKNLEEEKSKREKLEAISVFFIIF